MARESGYLVTAVLFVPSPKKDLKAQARILEQVNDVSENKNITPEFLKAARVVSVGAKFGSVEVEGTPATDASGTTAPAGNVAGGTADANARPNSQKTA